ncbi:TIGR03885 family FMN-dependent LLM class oxidoreductase [Nitrosomonas communis]|uniref:Probable non-F420 flavinoid oxidoreductase n=1 Tax=Nitrosomonas communis TaxID=44574 RepID=A0A1I4KH52_9PROT|nr:TIGR03885 family FMN-dependent LLM class oxidoreductase [Nitrosomonas communis]SFL78095.1 probable non-F420 flavinoid oxidoreductase [Nitrosomonas communis]
MLNLGYHISHEQFSPGELLKLAKKAAEAGFSFGLSSDHFSPWNFDQGHSGYAWSWLGAALSQTDLNFGIVTCPFFRYHPAIIAQAAATLDEMFPQRFWIAVGSGQALNESILGEYWPTKPERNERLKASVDIMRALWRSETVTTKEPIKVVEATLYTTPKSKMPVTGAALTPETAKWMASWADSLITISQPEERLKEIVDAWKENGGENKPIKLKVQLSYDKKFDDALQGAHQQWRTNIFASDLQSQLRNPQQFEQAAQHVKPEELKKMVNVSDEPDQHIEWLIRYRNMGFSDLILHNVNKKQEQFLEVFAEKVIPELKSL